MIELTFRYEPEHLKTYQSFSGRPRNRLTTIPSKIRHPLDVLKRLPTYPDAQAACILLAREPSMAGTKVRISRRLLDLARGIALIFADTPLLNGEANPIDNLLPGHPDEPTSAR